MCIRDRDNYIEILADSEFVGAVKTTFIFVVVSVVAHIVLGMCFALLLNTKYFKSRTKTCLLYTSSHVPFGWKENDHKSG